MHFPVAHAFAEAGFNVVSDKPMVHTSEQANKLIEVVEKTGVVFAVTYNYTGYPIVKEARHMVREGRLGELRKVIVEYNQGWLATKLEASGAKQADWRTDPARSGAAGAIGDIGSHAENLVSTVTGLDIEAICADLTTFVEGRRLDDDGNLLLRFEGGAKGVLIASQIEVGEENDLRLRVYGSEGGLSWRQEDPNHLLYKPLEGPTQILTRGQPYLCEAAQRASRLPAGHPEAFIEAFANVYKNVAATIQAKQAGAGGRGARGRLPHRLRRGQGRPFHRENRRERRERKKVDGGAARAFRLLTSSFRHLPAHQVCNRLLLKVTTPLGVDKPPAVRDVEIQPRARSPATLCGFGRVRGGRGDPRRTRALNPAARIRRRIAPNRRVNAALQSRWR